MKKIILAFILSLSACIGYAQTPAFSTQDNYTNYYRFHSYLGVDSGFLLPQRDTLWSPSRPAIVFRPQDSSIYLFNGQNWWKIGQSSSTPTGVYLIASNFIDSLNNNRQTISRSGDSLYLTFGGGVSMAPDSTLYATRYWVSTQGFLTTEVEPKFTGSAAATISTTNINSWNNAFVNGSYNAATDTLKFTTAAGGTTPIYIPLVQPSLDTIYAKIATTYQKYQVDSIARGKLDTGNYASGTNTVSVVAGNSAISIAGGTQSISANPTFTITPNNTMPLWNAVQLQGLPILNTAPSPGQVLFFNGTSWVPYSLNPGSGTVTSVGLNAGYGTVVTSNTTNPITSVGTFTVRNDTSTFAPNDNKASQYRMWGSVGINTQGYLTLKDTAHYALQVGDSTLGKGMILPIGDTLTLPPVKGGFVYNLSDSSLYYSDGTRWISNKYLMGLNDINYIGSGGDSASFYANSWYQHIREIGNVIKINDTTWAWSFTGYHGMYNEDSVWVGIAFSHDDCKTFKYSNKVSDSIHLEDPYIIKFGSLYYLYAEYKKDTLSTHNAGIYLMTSPDLITWTPRGNILPTDTTILWEKSDISSPTPFVRNDSILLFYEGRSLQIGNGGAIGLAYSTDGFHFTRDINNPIVIGTTTPPNLYPSADVVSWASEVVPDDIINYMGIYYMSIHAYAKSMDKFEPGIIYSYNFNDWYGLNNGYMHAEHNNDSTFGDGVEIAMVGDKLNLFYLNSIDTAMYRGFPMVQPSITGFIPTISNALNGQLIQYNGTNWTNWTPNYLTPSQNATITGNWTFLGIPTSSFIYAPEDATWTQGLIVNSSGIAPNGFVGSGNGNMIMAVNAKPADITGNSNLWTNGMNTEQNYALVTNATGLWQYSANYTTPDTASFSTFWTTKQQIATQNWVNSQGYINNNLATSNLKQIVSTLRNYNLNGGSLTFVDSTLLHVIPPFGNAYFSGNLNVIGGYSPYGTHYGNILMGSNGGSDTLNSRLILTAANLGTFTGAFMSQLTLDTLGMSFASSSPVTTVFNVDKNGDGRFYGNLGIVGDSLTMWPKTYTMTSPTIQSFQTRLNSSMNLTALDSVTAPVSGLDMYANSLSLELDNTASIQASGAVNMITGVRGALGLNMSGTTTKLWSANANIAGIVGTISIFNNANYQNISAIAAASPFSYTQGTYTKFTGIIDTSSQLYLQANPSPTYNVDANISNPYGIYQASDYPNRFSGGIQMPIRVVTGSTTVTTSDYTVVSASGTNTFTIPAASTCGGQVFHFVCNTGTVTLSVGYLNYSGTNTTTIAAGSGVTIQSNGTSYYQTGQ